MKISTLCYPKHQETEMTHFEFEEHFINYVVRQSGKLRNMDNMAHYVDFVTINAMCFAFRGVD